MITRASFLKRRYFSTLKDNINILSNQRFELGISPKPLDAKFTSELCSLLDKSPNNEKSFLLHTFINRIPPGVDEAAYVKASYLTSIVKNNNNKSIITKDHATELLGTMQGGYNVSTLIDLLDDDKLGYLAAQQLSKTILIFDAFYQVEEKFKKGNKNAEKLLKSWADAEWFTSKAKVPEKITVTVFKVSGETNTDDLSPAQDAWSRPDIPLHSLSMLKNKRDGINPNKDGEVGPIDQINKLKERGFPLAYVGDVVGTGSSRKSATNSILWFIGEDIPFVPNKKSGGVCIGGKIAPIFFNTMEDSGALPIEMPVDDLNTGDIIDIYPYLGLTKKYNSEEVICNWELKSSTILDSVQAGGRINLIIGKSLTNRARNSLGLNSSNLFIKNNIVSEKDIGHEVGYTLAQKMVGKACGLKEEKGILPGSYCEPIMTTVGSQDTTGPMTRDELKDLACLGFSADLVMQSFCHTAAYPKPVDVVTHHTLPDFIRNRGGVSLKPGDGIIHSWLNRMLLPDTVGTGGDSHTRFPIGISFPAGSGLVAFGAATGVMPLDMPESVLVKFTGQMRKGITLRDLVHAIPYFAIKKGLLTIEKKGKKNVFSGRILEIEGLEKLNLTCEQAFELSDASAERSAAGCTIKLSEESVSEYLTSNISLLKWMIREGYGDASTIERRISEMEKWISNPKLLSADKNAQYHTILEINLDEIKEPILCAPNDPDDARLLSEVSGDKIDEVFIGSCMTNIGHFRAAGKLLENFEGQLPTKLWMAPPTKMDEKKLIDEGFYSIYGKVGARTEMPGCSLCMGNQARVGDNTTVLSTSTRNFPNRLGKGANVYLASSELSAITAIEGKIPDVDTYMKYFDNIEDKKDEIFTYMNFDRLKEYNKN